MKGHPKHMKMSELSAHAQVPAATIWYYARMGLLPTPIKSGRKKAYYTAEHLEVLEQILSLKEKGLSLAAIGEVVKGERGLSPDSLESDSIYTSKRETIVRSAIELFREKGYNSTTIKDIVARAGSGKGTFYQYFKDKQELFFECADHVFYDIGRDDPSIRDEQDGLKRLWNRGHLFFHNHLHMIDMLNLARGASASGDNRFGQMLHKVMVNLIGPIEDDLVRAKCQGYIRFKDMRVLAYFLMGGVEYCCYFNQINPDCSIDAVQSKIWDMLLYGVLPGQGGKKPPRAVREEIRREVPLPEESVSPSEIPSGKREDILTAATELFLRKGYAEASIAELANSARMSKETIYQNFRSKEELFIACADRIFRGMYDDVWNEIKGEKDMLKRLSRRGKAFFSSFSKWIDMMNLVRSLSVGDNPSFKEKFRQLVRQMVNPMIKEIDQLKKEGRARKEIDSSLAAHLLLGMAEYGAQLCIQEDRSVEEELSLINVLLEKGIGRN